MHSYYSRWYDPVKDRRYGILFLVTAVIFFCLSALAMLAYGILDGRDIEESDLQNRILQILPGIAILMAVLIWRGIRRNQTRQKERFQRQELSRDEIRKARSKLVKTKN